MSEKDLMLEVARILYNKDDHQIKQNELIDLIGDLDEAMNVWNYLQTIEGFSIIPINEGILYLDYELYNQVHGKITQHYNEITNRKIGKLIDKSISILS